jgi:hypothetical protein
VLSVGSKRKLQTKVFYFASDILCIHLGKGSKWRINAATTFHSAPPTELLSYCLMLGACCFSHFQTQKYHKNTILPPTQQADVEFSGHV